jgi:DNA-binding response OmpR family regulator
MCQSLSVDERLKNVPRILLTAKDQVSEKVYGFNCGADDYITKPFNSVELKARVDRHLRRSGATDVIVTSSCFQFNLEFQKCYVMTDDQKRDLGLTPTEFRLFLNLVKKEGTVLSRQALERAAWEANGAVIETRGIDTHIAHLRKKLGPLKTSIVSIYGQGYSFQGSKAAS